MSKKVLRGEIIYHRGRPYQDPEFNPGRPPRYDHDTERLFEQLRDSNPLKSMNLLDEETFKKMMEIDEDFE